MKHLAPSFVVIVGVLGCGQAKEGPVALASASGSPAASAPAPPGSPPPSYSVAKKSGHPTWDEVESGHQGTNPPHPVLIVDAAGYCYKNFEGGMIPPGPNRLEGVCDKEHPCGKQIECPKNAGKVSRGGKAEMPDKDAIAIAEAHLDKKGSKPDGVASARYVESSKLWIVTWGDAKQPTATVMVDGISGRIVR